MISVTKLLFAREYFGDRLRYTKNAHTMRNGAAEGVGPVVVWNSTKTCNLKCMHCYMQSDAKKYKDELTTEEAKKFIDDLADWHADHARGRAAHQGHRRRLRRHLTRRPQGCQRQVPRRRRRL